MTAIPAAAEIPAMLEVAIAQNGPTMDSAAAIPSPIPAITSTGECA